MEERVAAGPDGKPQLLTQQCSTCIGRPGNPMRLRPGRVKQMVNACIRGGDGVVCHQTLSYGDHPEAGGAYCRWMYDTYGPLIQMFRIIGRTGGFCEIELPEIDDDEETA